VTPLRTLICGAAIAIAFVGAISLSPPMMGVAQLTRPSDRATVSDSTATAIHLLRLSQSLAATRTAKVLAIGSSSTVGVGASSPSQTYVARLETDLEDALKGTDFEVIGHGLSGEVAQGAADRMSARSKKSNRTS
jgi:cell division GTPase FtsZ